MASIGDKVLAPDDRHGFVLATVEEVDEDGLLRCATAAGDTVRVRRAAAVAADPLALEGCAQLASLSVLEEATLCHALRVRFGRGDIYAAVGDVLLSVNPYEPQRLASAEFGAAAMAAFVDADEREAPPHVFGLAERAVQRMGGGGSQAIVISGESGAGKTEAKRQVVTTYAPGVPQLHDLTSAYNPSPDLCLCLCSCRQVVTYLCSRHTLARGAGEGAAGGAAGGEGAAGESEGVALESKLLALNPLLEALGNAATARNHNSSRFGQWLSVTFSHAGAAGGRVTGGKVETYLLEASRVTDLVRRRRRAVAGSDQGQHGAEPRAQAEVRARLRRRGQARVNGRERERGAGGRGRGALRLRARASGVRTPARAPRLYWL